MWLAQTEGFERGANDRRGIARAILRRAARQGWRAEFAEGGLRREEPEATTVVGRIPPSAPFIFLTIEIFISFEPSGAPGCDFGCDSPEG